VPWLHHMQWAWELCGAVLRLSRGTASGRLGAYTFAKGLPQAEAHSGLRLAAPTAVWTPALEHRLKAGQV